MVKVYDPAARRISEIPKGERQKEGMGCVDPEATGGREYFGRLVRAGDRVPAPPWRGQVFVDGWGLWRREADEIPACDEVECRF